jgi:hypothetical protein
MNFGLDKNVPFSHQKEACEWCNGSLARLRNVYKGINSKRLYCSSEHLQNGENAHMRKLVDAAGRTS